MTPCQLRHPFNAYKIQSPRKLDYSLLLNTNSLLYLCSSFPGPSLYFNSTYLLCKVQLKFGSYRKHRLTSQWPPPPTPPTPKSSRVQTQPESLLWLCVSVLRHMPQPSTHSSGKQDGVDYDSSFRGLTSRN